MSFERYAMTMVFSPHRQRVLLIEKARPEWQRGWLNIPGGKAGSEEPMPLAAARELAEETSVHVNAQDLTLLLQMSNWECLLEVYLATCCLEGVKAMTDERLVVVDPRCLPHNVLDSTRWWISLALDTYVCLPIIYRDKGRNRSVEAQAGSGLTLNDLCQRGKFFYGGNQWSLCPDSLGWVLYRNGCLHRSYTVRPGVAADVLLDIFGECRGEGVKLT